MLYEFYKFFISQSTFQQPISAFLFKNNSTKILVMLAVSTSFTQVPEKQLIRIPEQCAVVYVFKWKVKNSKTLPSVSLLTRGSWASGRPLRCSRPRQSLHTHRAGSFFSSLITITALKRRRVGRTLVQCQANARSSPHLLRTWCNGHRFLQFLGWQSVNWVPRYLVRGIVASGWWIKTP